MYLKNAIWEDHKTHRLNVLLSNNRAHFITRNIMQDCLTKWQKRRDEISEIELLLEVEEFQVLEGGREWGGNLWIKYIWCLP